MRKAGIDHVCSVIQSYNDLCPELDARIEYLVSKIESLPRGPQTNLPINFLFEVEECFLQVRMCTEIFSRLLLRAYRPGTYKKDLEKSWQADKIINLLGKHPLYRFPEQIRADNRSIIRLSGDVMDETLFLSTYRECKNYLHKPPLSKMPAGNARQISIKSLFSWIAKFQALAADHIFFIPPDGDFIGRVRTGERSHEVICGHHEHSATDWSVHELKDSLPGGRRLNTTSLDKVELWVP